MHTYIQRQNQQVNRRHIKITYLLTTNGRGLPALYACRHACTLRLQACLHAITFTKLKAKLAGSPAR